MVSIEEMESRVAAAHAAAGLDGPLIIARTDVASLEGMDAGLARAERIAAAGADLVWVLGMQNLEPAVMIEARARIKAPMMVDDSEIRGGPEHGFAILAEAGFDVVLIPLSGILASLKSMQAMYARLFRDQNWRGYQDDLIELPTYHQWADRIVESD